MVSPTGQGVRSDAEGDGHFGASRGTREHNGADFLCIPGQDVYSPIRGALVREARPYGDDDYSGILIQNGLVEVKMFYFEPDPNLIGTTVAKGDVIGQAQDISKKYSPKMDPHIHCQVKVDGHFIDPETILYRNKEA